MKPKQAALLREFLDSREFYEMAQQYRCAPFTDQSKAINAFEDLKKGIIEGVQLAMNRGA